MGGRLKGKTDINPQWRYEVMTEVYGPCGTGWKFSVDRLWTEPGVNGVVFVFAQISLQVKEGVDWSAPIPGIGGNQLVEKEKEGLHNNDEAYKMAITDALSTATKMLGVAADIYAGLWGGSKYIDRTPGPANKTSAKAAEKPQAAKDPAKWMTAWLAEASKLREQLGNEAYYRVLKEFDIDHANQVQIRDKAKDIFTALTVALDDEGAKDDKNATTGEASGNDGASFPPSEG